MSFTPSKFGPKNGIDSKDYVLYMQGPGGPTSEPINLLGHSLTSPSQNLADALNYTDVIMKNGRAQTINRTKRAAYETSRTYTIGFPSALWTPLMDKFNCPITLYALYLCPEDRIFRHWDVLPEGYMNPPIEAEDVVTNTEETNIVAQTAEYNVPEKIRGWQLGWQRVYDITPALNAIVFQTVECAGCDILPGFSLIAGGGDGTAAPTSSITDDRFGSVSALTTGAAVGTTLTALFTEGDLILAGFADDNALGTAATGELRYSNDLGATWAAATGTGTDIIWDIVKVGNTFVAVGGDGTNGSVFYSENGVTWTELVNTLVNSAGGLYRAAVDTELGRVYAVGEGAKFLVLELSGSGFQVTDLEPNIPATAPTDLLSIAVLAQGHIVIGGTAGYLAESKDSGQTFVKPAFTSASDVTGLAGNLHRLVVAAGTALFERNAMLKNVITRITMELGQTLAGNVTRVVMGLDDNFNLFAGTTDAGEVFFGKPFYPNA